MSDGTNENDNDDSGGAADADVGADGLDVDGNESGGSEEDGVIGVNVVRLLSVSIGVVSVMVNGLVTVAFVDRRWNVVAARLNDWLAVVVDTDAAAVVVIPAAAAAAAGCCVACFQPCIL